MLIRQETSKYGSIEALHGSRGEFLSSLAALCLLTVVSRRHNYRSTNSVTFHHSEVVGRATPEIQSRGNALSAPGSRCIVRDLFGNMPVRVKQRAILQTCSTEIENLWEELKRGLVALLLAWKPLVSLKLIDLDTNKVILLSGRNKPISTLNPSRDDSHEPTIRFSSLLNQAQLIEFVAPSNWIPASASSRDLTIKGLIGIDAFPSKNLQFLALEVCPLERTAGIHEFYDLINRLFDASDFGIQETTHKEAREVVSSRSRSISPNSKTSRRKGVDRWPAYFLQITLKGYSGLLSSKLTRDESFTSRISEVLKTLVDTWLESHHFRLSKSNVSKVNEPTSLLFRRPGSLTPLSKPSSPSVAVGKRSINQYFEESQSIQPPSRRPFRSTKESTTSIGFLNRTPNPLGQSLNSGRASSISQPSADVSLNGLTHGNWVSAMPSTKEQSTTDETFSWIDAYNNQTHLLNSRTGVSSIHMKELGSPVQAQTRRLTLRNSTPCNSKSSPSWMKDIEKNWKSTLFKDAEPRIAQVCPPALSSNEDYPLALFDRSEARAVHQLQKDILSSKPIKLTKEDLSEARVISQVDKQFILISLSKNEGTKSLVIVDQHAADERYRVEKLLEDLCKLPAANEEPQIQSNLGLKSSVNCTPLDNFLKFQIPHHELKHFQQHAAFFAHWGILYNIPLNQSSKQAKMGELEIIALPTVIAERASGDPQLLITTIREELWKVVDNGKTRPTSASKDDVSSTGIVESKLWHQKIGQCPTRIFDMIASRACRSAIMFNDELSTAECKDLLLRLSKCVFPFQCAHGRPSMVPLIKIKSQSTEDFGGMSFTQAYKSWKGKDNNVS